jgi:NDP-4-keto-2,6-dideoxyhexose 3-C-methyltransferase
MLEAAMKKSAGSATQVSDAPAPHPPSNSPSVISPATAAPQVKERTTCRSCDSSWLSPVLDFGNPYISNFADRVDAAAWPRVPLEVLLCEKCSLLQLRHTTPGEWLYQRYWYKSGTNQMMRAALGDIARKASEFAGLTNGQSVLDIGCNDGTLLRSYGVAGIRRVGFEPSNLAGEAAEGTDRIIPEFFSARPVEGERFRVVTSIAMFYDLEDPNAFVADVAKILDPEGVWVIEMHYLPLTIARNAFDAVCHEHLEYYSLSSLEPLLARHGLEVADAETNEVNGGSFRVYVAHRGSARAPREGRYRVEAMRIREQSLALTRPATYADFGRRVDEIGERLVRWIDWERAQGHSISAYGASTKGNTLLQAFSLEVPRLRSAAERNPEKWGKYTVGTWIPIVSEEEARSHAGAFLILPWHFLAGIEERERDFVRHGGKLLIPLPEPMVIDSRGAQPLS